MPVDKLLYAVFALWVATHMVRYAYWWVGLVQDHLDYRAAERQSRAEV